MLHQFIRINNSREVQACISRGEDVNQLSYGQAPLHLAAHLGCAKIAHILVAAGADILLEDEYHRTPEVYARKSDKTGTLKKALQLNTAEAWEKAIDAEHKDRLWTFAERELPTLHSRTQYSRLFSNNAQYMALRDHLKMAILTEQLKNQSDIRNFISEYQNEQQPSQTQPSTAQTSFNND